MSEQILMSLKRAVDDAATRGNIGVETLRNVLKEELQYYVLDFIYHHSSYRNWVMYGGSALRICHGLNRMSVDLDFEIPEPCTESFLQILKKEVFEHFKNTYAAGDDFLVVKITNRRGLLLKFLIGNKLGIKHHSEQVHVKIDCNYFIAPTPVTERVPINHSQLSFVITTYSLSALMASKIVAVFQRGTRGVGTAVYEEKGRDIYDLLWYMEKKIVPNLDYLTAKGIDAHDLRGLFDRVTLKMNKVSDSNLRQDLMPLFMDQRYIKNWLAHWRESYFSLLESYKIRAVTHLREWAMYQDFSTDNYSFRYRYETEEGSLVRVICNISDLWVEEIDLPIAIDEELIALAENDTKSRLSDHHKRYATLFYKKIETYFKKMNKVTLHDALTTKFIRKTADRFDQKEQIILDKSTLLSCTLEDLLK